MHNFLRSDPLVFAGCLVILALGTHAARAGEDIPACAVTDRPCIMRQIETLAPAIEKQDWKDQTYRELAKTYTYEGLPDKAFALIPLIKNPDTQAMAIRGIGMAAASGKWSKSRYDSLFVKLKEYAETINHAPSKGIAYTYIAMAQAFAGDDDGARATAATMENGALRNKAYGETAEIQAERGDIKNALISLKAIDSAPYRQKAYDTVSKIFAERDYINEAFEIASAIENPYLRANALQRILNKGNAEEETNTTSSSAAVGLE